jgi:3-hydroxybutyryl-CoA dehydrogenase
VDLAIECVPEDMSIKAVTLAALNQHCSESAVLASNTSSLSIGKLAMLSGRPDRFVGLHFFNPADVMSLVEIAVLPETSPDIAEAVSCFVRALGKEPIVVPDSPGFVVNRLLFAMICEAMRVFAAGVATAEQIDRAMKLGTNTTTGPLALADAIGLDTCQAILRNLALGLGDRYSPPEFLAAMVASGKIGRKAGVGFYTY